jgi:3-phenylpropionate/cinnamic acid dioxygenase small subunit
MTQPTDSPQVAAPSETAPNESVGTGGAAHMAVPGTIPAPELAAFIHLEARLADESRYAEWEALWDDDACYWVPTHEDADPEHDVSYIFDNRHRLASRIRQLQTGVRHAQSPPSKIRRLISNLEVVASDAATVTIGSNFALFEHRYTTTIWAGRYLHCLRITPTGPRLVSKTVHLVNAADAVPTMAFLL